MRFLPLPAMVLALVLGASVGCNAGSKEPAPVAPVAPVASAASPASSATPGTAAGALHLGSAIESSVEKVALADVAKNPSAFVGKKFVTTGTVTAVCQHMGCWMEIKDDASEAHVKMAGHGFFVPKTASGRKARVLATLVKNEGEPACADEGHDAKMATASGAGATGAPKKGCRAEAEAQLGRPLAKLELVADGVEIM